MNMKKVKDTICIILALVIAIVGVMAILQIFKGMPESIINTKYLLTTLIMASAAILSATGLFMYGRYVVYKHM